MVKPDQRKRLQQIARLRLAAETVDWLRQERRDLMKGIPIGVAEQLRTLADAYEASPVKPFYNCKECREGTCRIHVTAPLRMHDEQRKTSARDQDLIMRANSDKRVQAGILKLGKKKRSIPIAQREFDEEAEHEEGQTFGHDIPDGSD